MHILPASVGTFLGPARPPTRTRRLTLQYLPLKASTPAPDFMLQVGSRPAESGYYCL